MYYNCNDSNLKGKSFFPEIKQLIQKTTNNEFLFNLLYKPAPYFLIFLLFCGIFTIKNGIKYSLTIFAPIYLNVFIISISLTGMNPKYLFILFLSSPIVILLSFLKTNPN